MTAQKRLITTVFSNKDDIYSHQVRLVLAEKGVPYEVVNIEPNEQNEELLSLNPRGTIPTLTDREIVIFETRIILEYLEERFPHPPLMQGYPVERAKARLYMHLLEKEYFSLLTEALNAKTATEHNAKLKQLKEQMLAISPALEKTEYFQSDTFGMIDCYLAVLLYKMHQLGVTYGNAKGAKVLNSYMARVFQRNSFKQSIDTENTQFLVDEKD